MYYKEIEQKEKINARINFPIGIITLLTGGVVYLIKQGRLPFGCLSGLFYFFFALFILNICISLYFVFKAYYGHRYDYLPSTLDIHEQTEKIIKYYDDNYVKFFREKVNKTKQELISEMLDKNMYEIMRDATNINRSSNFVKIKYLGYIGWSLIPALFIGIISITLYSLSK